MRNLKVLTQAAPLESRRRNEKDSKNKADPAILPETAIPAQPNKEGDKGHRSDQPPTTAAR